MALNDEDLAEIKRLFCNALNGDNPGFLKKLTDDLVSRISSTFVTKEMCQVRRTSQKWWNTIILGMLLLTFSAAALAAIRATISAGNVELMKQLMSTLLPGLAG